MLDLMRRQSYLIPIIFGGIIVIFAFNFGPGSAGCMRSMGSPQNWAARVDGEAIQQQEFAVQYSRQFDFLRRSAERSGQELTAEMADRYGIRQMVINHLVDGKLLAQQATQRGLTVSDAELAEYLNEQMGVGDVTYDVYSDWVNRTFDMSVKRFEENTRAEVAASKLAQAISDGVVVSDAELKDAYVRMHDRVKIDYVRFTIDPTHAPEPSAADVAHLIATDMPAVSKEYDANLGEYRIPEQARVRQIVKRLPENAPVADVAKARDALLALRKQIEAGADFGALAKEHSEDAKTAAAGGDMGFIGHGQVARDLDQAIFNLGANQMPPDPIRTPEGLHLVQLQEIKAAQNKPIDEVKNQVAAAVLRHRAAQTVTQNQANAFLADLRAGKALAALTVSEMAVQGKDTRPIVHTTPWISRTDRGMARIGINHEMQAALFDLTKTAPHLPQAYTINDSLYVGTLHEREMPDLSKFANESETLRTEAMREKGDHVLRGWLAYLRARASVQLNPAVVNPPQQPGASGNG